MRGFSFLVAVSLLIVAMFAVPAVAQDGGDAVRKTDGTWLIDQYGDADPTRDEMKDGKIVVIKEEYDYVHYKFRTVAGNQRIPQGEVKHVLYYQRDPSYDRAVEMMNARDYEGALEAFKQAAESRVAWVPQYAMWNIVLLQEGLGQPQEALAAIDALTRKFPRSKYLIDARIKAGKIRLSLGDEDGAKREFAKIRSIPKIPENIEAEVDYWLIYIEEQQARTKSDLERIKGKYETLLGQVRSKYKNVETKCRLGMGRCLVKLEKYEEALAFFEKITKESKDPEVLAGAYLMIGEAYFAMQKWVEARRAYLRVCVMWDEYPEIHAQALCRAGNCFLLTRDTDYKNRARQELTRCYNRYPGSSWARQAKDLEGTIR